MDFCHTCQRTLNGALACPGCGVYGLDAEAVAGRPAVQGVAPHTPLPPVGAGVDEGGSRDGGIEEPVLGPASLAPTLHQGRAARRRQRDRWKKSRRRAGVATAVALFGGGVASVAVSSHSAKAPTAAAAPNDDVAPVTLTSHAGHDQHGGVPTYGTADHLTTQTSTHTVTLPQPGTSAQARSAHSGSVGSASHRDAGGSGTGTTAHSPATGIHGGQSASGGTSQGNGGSGSGTVSVPGSGSTGGGTTTTTSPPVTTPPTSPAPPPTTAPTTPPQHLCLLVICLD